MTDVNVLNETVQMRTYHSHSATILFFCSRIEETWRLWQKFLDDYSRFEDWLKTSERKAALPNSSGVLYTVAKEELKKFEVSIFLSESTLYVLKFEFLFIVFNMGKMNLWAKKYSAL